MSDNDSRPTSQPSSGLGRVSYSLVISWPDGATERVGVGDDPLSVGRAEGCDIRIREDRVSRRHCLIFMRAGQLNLQDQGSSNGTFVNDEQVRQARLNIGDVVKVGSAVLHIQVADLGGSYRAGGRRSRVPGPKHLGEELSGGSALLHVSLVDKLAQLIARSIDPQSAAEALQELLIEALSVDRCFTFQRKPPAGTEELTILAAKKRAEGLRFEKGPANSFVKRVVTRGETYCILDVSQDRSLPDEMRAELPGIRTVLCAPLVYEGEVTGAIYADVLASSAEAAPEVISAFETLAIQAGTILERAQRYAKISSKYQVLMSERFKLREHCRELEAKLAKMSAQSEERRFDAAIRLTEVETLRESRESMALDLVQDVRTVVDTIESRLVGLTDLAAENDALQRIVAQIRQEATYLVTHSEDTLAVIQMENGAYGLQTAPVPVVNLLMEAFDRNSTAAAALGVTLEVAEVEPDVVAIADRHVVGRILDNLIGNALREIRGGGQVSLWAVPDENTVEIRVIDSGLDVRVSDVRRPLATSKSAVKRDLDAINSTGMLFCRLAAAAHGGSIQTLVGKEVNRWALTLPSRIERDLERTETS